MTILALIPRPTAGFQAQTLENEVVLLHPIQNVIIYLNTSGALVWSLCDGKRSVAKIIELLVAVYPESEKDIRADVQHIIQELMARGALTAA